MATRIFRILLLWSLMSHLIHGTAKTTPDDPNDSDSDLYSEQDVTVQKISSGCPIGCDCHDVSFSRTVKIDCKFYSDSNLPQTLPSLKNGSTYELDFTRSSLRSINYREYLKNATKIILSQSDIRNISDSAWHAWSCDVEVLHLDHNKLQSLPEELNEAKFHHLVDLKLGSNPWVCNCKALGLREFVLMQGRVIKDGDDVKCHSPSNVADEKVIDVGVYEYCNQPKANLAPYIAIAVIVVLLVIVGITIMVIMSRR